MGMQICMPRRSFLGANAGAVGIPFAMSAQKIPDRGPQIAGELVKEFVVAAHAKLDRTHELLARDAQLIHATWDWGGGDVRRARGGEGGDHGVSESEKRAGAAQDSAGGARQARRGSGRGGGRVARVAQVAWSEAG